MSPTPKYAEPNQESKSSTEGLGHIVLVEDDNSIATGMSQSLRAAGYRVTLIDDGERASEAALAADPSLIILDLNLPGMSGFELLEQWQSRSSVPVIVLTARVELEDRLRSFGLGASDYLSKPFWMEELLARIAARLGQRAKEPERVLTFPGLSINLDTRSVSLGDGEQVSLTAHEFNVLALLAERSGRALSRSFIADKALPSGGSRSDRTIDVHVTRIRSKLGGVASYLKTAWGVGYCFDVDGAV